ncbi:zinc finger, CCHC-type containing protein [Tanacetum coccineum]
MDVKTTFLNGELDEEQAPKQWHQKFDEVVLSNGYLLNQAEKCVYSKFFESSKGVVICLYVDEMLIFGTDQVQVDLTKEFLSSRFSMKDIGEADVILVLGVNHESNSEKQFLSLIILRRPAIAFVVGKLSSYPSVLKGFTKLMQAGSTTLKTIRLPMASKKKKMVNTHHKEVLNASTSKGAEPLASDAEHDDNDNGSSSVRASTIERNEMTTYRDFTACDVPKFDGALDPISSTRWLAAVEGEFRTSNCKEKNKVNFASKLFS